jgi:hypothetical protein
VDTVAACCVFCNRSGQNLGNKIYQVGGNRSLRADAVSDGLPTSQSAARSSRTCGEKFVRSDAKEFRSPIRSRSHYGCARCPLLAALTACIASVRRVQMVDMKIRN